jgi:hypothetical protein
MTCDPADIRRQAADADARADALFEQIDAARMKLPGNEFGARPLYVPGFEAHLEQARSLRVQARDLRGEVAASGSVAASGNVQSTGTPPPPSPSTAAEAISPFASSKLQTAHVTNDAEATARRILNSDAAAYIHSETDEVGIVALRIASSDIGAPDDVDAIAARIAGA